MKERFTPGPWRVTEGRDQMCDPGSTIEWDEQLRAGIFTDSDKLKDRKADLVLKSAAPELYEALKVLKAWVGKLEDWKGEDPPTEIVDKALTKATTI